MDGDPAVEPQLDSFSLVFPLPYRVGFIVTLAVWGWALNLHGLRLINVDVPALIRYPGRASPHHAAHHTSTYRLATALSALFALSITLFWLLTWRLPSRVIAYDWLPMTYLVALVALFFLPLRALPSGGRRRFFATLRRVSIGGIAEAHDGKFGDILLADVLTSYAKVCGDLFVALCMFVSPGGSSTDRPDRNCGGVVLVPLLMAVPSLIRFRQCVIEYLRVRRAPYKESTGWGGQHLANALKYSTAFPVLITSSLQRNVQDEGAQAALNRSWLAAVLVNSLYSFYWDVAKDWDLTLFAPRRERNSPHHAWGLRDRLLFRSAGLYYAVIGLDLMLRCTWSMKLSPHLYKFSDFESGIFLIQLLEVLRRWVWMFFRVETEWIRNSSTGLSIDDILLGDYQGKHEDDE
ncbi:EXS family protein [Hirsutella rhossiliensis]|uniref:EXS family domain-containing protein n=1 Tax=Hirsutella rhossiliensis TaxID=111463 RepID=A0A9P8SHL9_9HYPO|nr:EXS family domain-containing protein [Hirsutella rhossiliensis]KAH0963258.1 EXS family domain-containing protein [Hirsutella rhossiliensis]